MQCILCVQSESDLITVPDFVRKGEIQCLVGMEVAGKAASHLFPLVVAGHGARRALGRQQVGDRVVEARQVDGHPGAQEDGVAHQRLVLEGGPEAAVRPALDARPQRLHVTPCRVCTFLRRALTGSLTPKTYGKVRYGCLKEVFWTTAHEVERNVVKQTSERQKIPKAMHSNNKGVKSQSITCHARKPLVTLVNRMNRFGPLYAQHPALHMGLNCTAAPAHTFLMVPRMPETVRTEAPSNLATSRPLLNMPPMNAVCFAICAQHRTHQDITHSKLGTNTRDVYSRGGTVAKSPCTRCISSE